MKYKIGKTVDFNWEIWDYYYNTDAQYEGTERLNGNIESYDEEKKTYSIRVGDILYQGVKEYEIVNKADEFKKNFTDIKIKIADAVLKIRNTLLGNNKELNDLFSEYDKIEDKYIMLTKEQ